LCDGLGGAASAGVTDPDAAVEVQQYVVVLGEEGGEGHWAGVRIIAAPVWTNGPTRRWWLLDEGLIGSACAPHYSALVASRTAPRHADRRGGRWPRFSTAPRFCSPIPRERRHRGIPERPIGRPAGGSLGAT